MSRQKGKEEHTPDENKNTVMTHLQTSPSAYKFSNNACLAANQINIFTRSCKRDNHSKTAHSNTLIEEKSISSECRLKNRLVDFLSKAEVRNVLVLSILILAFSYLYGGATTPRVKTKINIENNKMTTDEGVNISPLMVPDKYMLQ